MCTIATARGKSDGAHIDVKIDHVEKHNDYSVFMIFHTNDIAMVYLERDVEFTGNHKIRSVSRTC